VLAFEERREEISPIPRLVAQGRHTAPTPLSPTIREITLGETINADIAVAGPPCTTTHGWPVPCHCYAFTPSADGTVTATLTWDALKTDTILLLRIENTQLEASVSPIVGELSVRAGQRYTLQVGMAGTGDFGPKPYVLTMAVQLDDGGPTKRSRAKSHCVLRRISASPSASACGACPAGDRDFAKQPRRPVIRDLLRIDQVNGRSLVCFRTAMRRSLSFTWVPEPHLPNPQAADRFGFCA
jgi:hypothetical protein